MALSLRQKQQDAIKRMLNLNQPIGTAAGGDEMYKILIFDKHCRDILSPLVHLNDLRKHGVTVYFPIDSDRQNIPDAPAVYFVQPTSANIQRILRDASRGVYDFFHLNFSSSLPRTMLEELATGALKNNCIHRITRIFDQYTEFVTLESGVFSLAQPEAYVQLNDPAAQENDIEAVVEGVVNGLFSVFITLGAVPVICCPKGGPAEMVGSRLESRIRDHLVTRNNLFTEGGHYGSSFQRPLCCIFDRNLELSVGLQHVWLYKPLVHDLLGMKLNRVTVPGEDNKSAKWFELDETDSFWMANKSAPFPKIAEEVEAQLKKYREDISKVNKTSGRGDQPLDDEELMGHTKHLMSAVSSLPELTERKKVIDKHTNIASALLANIKSRNVDGFHGLEEDMLTKGTVDKAAFHAALKGSKGTHEDKLRLAVVYLLVMESATTSDVDAIEAALRESDIDVSAFMYVKRIRSFMPAFGDAGAGTSRGNLVDWLSTTVSAGVKSLLSTGKQLAISRAVESLMEPKVAAPELENYLVFDPRAPRGTSGGGIHTKGPFKEAVVFMVGGGNFLEQGCLQELAQPPRNIIYGATEMLTGAEFIQQLAALGRKMGLTG